MDKKRITKLLKLSQLKKTLETSPGLKTPAFSEENEVYLRKLEEISPDREDKISDFFDLEEAEVYPGDPDNFIIPLDSREFPRDTDVFGDFDDLKPF